ncbi:uncharacterized protein TNCV_2176551 [Trichonephila clavipes]|uniref:Mutator-like transposase domain-containing protein n=1 Tax=Trichonephila clavipes TaxID=2585209 RepID=A0A8X6VTW7_TRICX|nr:uncharacterized protein TNCV_2176551 [Trichonephila clavipes]
MLDLLFHSKTAFRNQELKIQQAASIVSIESMKNAATEVKKLKNSPLESISCCGVSLDGTWQKRGYSSHDGCVSCISIYTGKILDIEIMSRFCRICLKKAKVPDAASNAHVCCNHMGSASSMETVGAYRIFELSEYHRKLQYTDYYGEGDCKAYESVKSMYAPNTVNKLECIGHVQKRAGSHLRKLKKKYVKGLGEKGKLTDNFIDKLQKYYGIAIRSNTKKLATMQNAVIAAFYHCCSSAKKSMHGQCPTGTDSWCKFQKAKALVKIFTAKAPGLPQNILNIVKPRYFKLCDQKLLEKCLHGLTQNANESFDGVLWNIVPKQNFVELQSLKLGAYIAVLQFNVGASGLLKVINKLGFNAGSYMIRVLKLYDYRRINEAERHSLPFTKLKRKKKKKKHELSERKKGLHQEEKEGVTYHSGEF